MTSIPYSSLFTPRDARNYRVFTAWMFAAAVVFMTATVLLAEELIAPGVLGWTLTAATVILLLLTVRAYSFFLRNADELLRKIHLDALALAFGTGVVVMTGYRLCERLGAPPLDINDPIVFMLLAWAFGQWLGMRRFGGSEEGQP